MTIVNWYDGSFVAKFVALQGKLTCVRVRRPSVIDSCSPLHNGEGVTEGAWVRLNRFGALYVDASQRFGERTRIFCPNVDRLIERYIRKFQSYAGCIGFNCCGVLTKFTTSLNRVTCGRGIGHGRAGGTLGMRLAHVYS